MKDYSSTNEQLRSSPCPFCKGTEPVVWVGNIDKRVYVAVRCKDCGAIGPQYFVETTDAHLMAVLQWKNTHVL